ncbi:MAG: type II toxin-antitoxin system HicB family antitoxin [Verrucomicrobiota bacterium]
MADDSDFDVVVHPLEGHTFWGEVVGMPGCVTQGASYTEILERLEDAFEACSESPPVNPRVRPDKNAFASVKTMGDLAAFLHSLGWTVTKSSQQHDIFHSPDNTMRLTVLRDPEVALYPQVHEAMAKLLCEQ